MNDAKPGDEVRDRDFVATPTPQELQRAAEQALKEEDQAFSPEDIRMIELLGKFDFEKFALWLERGERDAAGNPTAHAEHLMHAARILNGANNPEGACNILRRAISEVRGHDEVSERKAIGLLWKYGGEQAVKDLATELNEDMTPPTGTPKVEIGGGETLAELSMRNAEIQKELIDIQRHDFNVEERFGAGKSGEDAWQGRIKELKEELNEITVKRSALMR